MRLGDFSPSGWAIPATPSLFKKSKFFGRPGHCLRRRPRGLKPSYGQWLASRAACLHACWQLLPPASPTGSSLRRAPRPAPLRCHLPLQASFSAAPRPRLRPDLLRFEWGTSDLRARACALDTPSCMRFQWLSPSQLALHAPSAPPPQPPHVSIRYAVTAHHRRPAYWTDSEHADLMR